MLLNTISVGILCGGQGSRMGGVDKGLIELEGTPLLAHTLKGVPADVYQILINANRNQEQYATFGYCVIRDQFTGFKGPLAGMEALLSALDSDWLLTLPCDTPNYPRDLLHRLIEAADDSILVRCAHDGEYRQAVFSLMHRSVLNPLRAFLQRGEAKIDRFFAEVGFVDVDFSDNPHGFYNLNRPEDLADFSPQNP